MQHILEELRLSIERGPTPLVVCGAGVSTEATAGKAPSWVNLIRSGIQRISFLRSDASAWAAYALERLSGLVAADWIAVAEEVTERLGGKDSLEYRSWLMDQFSGLSPEKTQLLQAIEALGCPLATTNYDSILLRHTNRDLIIWNDYGRVLKFLNGDINGILHLHGHWQSPESLVLGQGSYLALNQDKRREMFQSITLATRPILFIGCSEDGLNDPDFTYTRSSLYDVRSATQKQYWLVKGESAKELNPDFQKNIYPVTYGSNYSELAPFLQKLKHDSN